MISKPIASFFGKIAFTSAVIWVVFRRIDASQVLNSLRGADPATAIFATASFIVPLWVAGWRWQRLLSLCKVRAAYFPLLWAAHIGQFFALFVPGPLGDDTARVLYLTRLTGGQTSLALSSVMLDRLVGLSSVLLMGAVCVPLNWEPLSGNLETRFLGQALVSFAALLLIAFATLLLLGPARFSRVLGAVLGRLPRSIPTTRLLEILNAAYQRRRGLGPVFFAAFLAQLIMCGSFCLAGRAVGINLPFLNWLGFVPVILVSSALPVTLAGIGVRDFLMALFLGVLAGVDHSRAVAASMIILGGNVFTALLGGLVFLVHRPNRPHAESDGSTPFQSPSSPVNSSIP